MGLFLPTMLALGLGFLAGCGVSPDRGPLTVVVMDPLARELACECVGGYAQRDYPRLAGWLSGQLRRPVQVVFAESLDKGLRHAGRLAPGLVIGKESLVRADAVAMQIALRPLARLTDTEGRTTLTGFFVVRAKDPAKSLSDLRTRRILFGLPEAEEKHAAALAALVEHGVPIPERLETRSGCAEAALEVQDSEASPAPVAVISSYALPLLEGCGNAEPGALRVLGHTRPVPFVTLFAMPALSQAAAERVRSALLALRDDAALLRVMESKSGFEPWTGADWPDWQGPGRDARVERLPARLPAQPRVLWRQPAQGPGLAGLAATSDFLVVAERDVADARDVFRCLRTADGRLLWTLDYSAAGELDYGQSPRATPVLHEGRAYLLGAFGHLHCVKLDTGEVLWRLHLVNDLGGKLPGWGYCGTPLVVDHLLVVNPGGPGASLVALNRHTGTVVWRTPGAEAAYASFIVGEFSGRRQIVGYDAQSLGGWDARTGRRLWTLVPPRSGDFNVPTPLAVDGQLLVATENNGTRLYGFRPNGRIEPRPLASSDALSPETTTPIVAAGRVIGLGSGLVCLGLANGLAQKWAVEDEGLATHASLIASDSRLLVLTHGGELLLLDLAAPGGEVLSRCRVAASPAELYAHPAWVAGRLFLRDAQSVACLTFD